MLETIIAYLKALFWVALYFFTVFITSLEVTYLSQFNIIRYWPFSSDLMWFFWTIFQYVVLVILILKTFFEKPQKARKSNQEEILEEFQKSKERIRKELNDAKRERVDISIIPVDKDISVTSSKFGGRMYWKKALDYPMSVRGTPLSCIAQINLKDLPKNELLPSKGLLQFFIATDDYTLGDKGDFKVVYHETFSLSDNEDNLPEIKYNVEHPIEGVLELKFKNSKQVYPYHHNNKFDDILGKKLTDSYVLENNEQIINYFQLEYGIGYDDVEPLSQIGGYPYPIQQDRFEADKYVLLFQMGSYYGKNEGHKNHEISWGDAGAAYFYIAKEDLVKLDFTKVLYHWNCY